jgi:hypothetical protein
MYVCTLYVELTASPSHKYIEAGNHTKSMEQNHKWDIAAAEIGGSIYTRPLNTTKCIMLKELHHLKCL